MLWQLIKLLCLPLVYQSSVMEDVCENGISTEELDKIEVACQFHYHNLPDYCFVRTAVRAISDPSFFEQHVLHGGPDQRAASTTTRAVYTTHLQNLHTWGVVRSIGFLCIRTVCRYFAVAKRKTLHGQSLTAETSASCATPLPECGCLTRSIFQVFSDPSLEMCACDLSTCDTTSIKFPFTTKLATILWSKSAENITHGRRCPWVGAGHQVSLKL